MRLFLFLVALFVLNGVSAQIPNYLFYDANQSQSFGAENGITLHRFLYEKTDEIVPLKLTEEHNFSTKLLGVSYRALKIALLDLQVDWMFMLIQHEAFGHGSRAREFGYSENSYKLNLLPPFGSGEGEIRFGTLDPNERLTNVEDIALYFGGNEGNILFSEKIASRVVLQKDMHYRQAMLYFLTKNNLGFYIWKDKFEGQGGGRRRGDIELYVDRINGMNTGGGIYTVDKLAKQSLISILNPFQFYSTYVLTKSYLLNGKATDKRMPSIKVKNINYLPALGYNLTPFGSEFIFSQYFFSEEQSFQVNLNYGDNTFFDFYGAGLKIINILPSSKLYLGAELQTWSQPELHLENNKQMSNDPQLGLLVKADCSYFPFKLHEKFGIYTQAGYKTKGYVVGERFDEGLFFQFGISMKTDD